MNGAPLTDLVAGPLASAPRGGGEHTARDTVRTRVVLDTSVLVADPACIGGFEAVDVVIPLTVIEELDSLKSRLDDVGRAARTALRSIEELRVRAGGSLAEPVAVDERPTAATLCIEINGVQK